MLIGDRLRAIRESKDLSQGDIEKRTGLIRCYVSRVENGHTVPAVETLEKFARALEVPLYQIFYETEAALFLPQANASAGWGAKGKDSRYLAKFARALGRMNTRDREMLLSVAQKMAQR